MPQASTISNHVSPSPPARTRIRLSTTTPRRRPSQLRFRLPSPSCAQDTLLYGVPNEALEVCRDAMLLSRRIESQVQLRGTTAASTAAATVSPTAMKLPISPSRRNATRRCFRARGNRLYTVAQVEAVPVLLAATVLAAHPMHTPRADVKSPSSYMRAPDSERMSRAASPRRTLYTPRLPSRNGPIQHPRHDAAQSLPKPVTPSTASQPMHVSPRYTSDRPARLPSLDDDVWEGWVADTNSSASVAASPSVFDVAAFVQRVSFS